MIVPRRSFLLLVGNDGALLLPPLHLKNLSPQIIDDHSDEAAQSALLTLNQSPQTPVILLADTSAQTMKLDVLPALSALDRHKLMQRRLAQSFPSHAFKTVVPHGKERALYLNVEEDGPIGIWLHRLAPLPNPSGGVASLPLEAASLLAKLRPEANKGWAMLLLWHRTGGFRQIVTLDGKLVFSRLAAQLPDIASAQSALGFLAVDIQATQSYLSRFGPTNETPFSLTAILPPSLKPSFSAIFAETDSLVLSPHDALCKLDLKTTTGPDEPFCDWLSATWVATRMRLHRLMIKPHDKWALIHATAQKIGTAGATLTLAIALLCGMGMLWTASSQALRARGLRTGIAELQTELNQTQSTLAPATEPLGRLREAIERRRLFTATPGEEMMALAANLAPVLGSDVRATQFVWNKNELLIDLQLQVTGQNAAERSPAEIVQNFDAIAQNMRTALPGYSINIVHYPFPTLPSETISNVSPTPTQPIARFAIRKEQP